MSHINDTVADLLKELDLGTSVAETDRLLEVARVETSAFTDLLGDKVDLIPGTKGSGKSALFRIFVDFLPDMLLQARKIVVAHGVEDPGDAVFNAFSDEFKKLDEHQFVSFWCIYLVSLAHEQFIKGARYASYLAGADSEVSAFRNACAAAGIPEVRAPKSLRSILEWTLNVLRAWRPKMIYRPPEGQGEFVLDLFDTRQAGSSERTAQEHNQNELPRYIVRVKKALENILQRVNLSIWLMIDRLDEIFPRRSELERTALRGLLRAVRIFWSESIRVKVFLRDDMLENVVKGENGFVALTHITSRQADTLRWTEDQILSMVVKRIFANQSIQKYLKIDLERLDASMQYRSDAFYKVFPPKVHKGENQSATLKWIYTRCADGRGVVTPRDVLDMLIRAKQKQQDMCRGNPAGRSEWIIGSAALQYGLAEMSKRKRQTYLEAEFPHLWPHIKKLTGGKTEYSEAALGRVFEGKWKEIVDDLVSIGLFAKTTRRKATAYVIPFLYRKGLEVTQGLA
jgi:hypothetical protein